MVVFHKIDSNVFAIKKRRCDFVTVLKKNKFDDLAVVKRSKYHVQDFTNEGAKLIFQKVDKNVQLHQEKTMQLRSSPEKKSLMISLVKKASDVPCPRIYDRGCKVNFLES
jgi:hypothetical protein